ncbi:MAG: B12-binding domain-containing radical SAM protein [candidate division KSB1 bacterium]|nr:B12-binding domain-containing radical SAM protein [candidate division KSB1 bacterium]
MAKVVLIEPRADFNGYALFRLPLLGLLYMGTILKQRGHQVTIFVESIYPAMDERTGRLDPEVEQADVVGLSGMTCTIHRAYALARKVRQRNPRARVVIGGPHASFVPEEACEVADAVVIGESDRRIVDIVESPAAAHGIVQGEPAVDLDSLPVPDLGLIKGLRELRWVPLATSRGCPYDCRFCSVTKMFGRRFRHRSPDGILAEIEQRLREGHHRFFFYDDNFGIDRHTTRQWLEEVVRRGWRLRWSAQTRVEIANDDDLLQLLARSGCYYLFIGMESVNPETLRDYRKRQTLEDIRTCVRKLHRSGIHVHGMFVLGSDADDKTTVQETVRFCDEERIDTAQFAILCPFPGTDLYRDLEAQGRILTRNWRFYDGTHVVFRPLRMTALELQRQFLWAWKKFYRAANLKAFLISRYLLRQWESLNRRFLDLLRRDLLGELDRL